MQTLIFNTTNRTVLLYSGNEGTTLVVGFEKVPTVKVEKEYYEVMQKQEDDSTIPVLRVPISNTNMFIRK